MTKLSSAKPSSSITLRIKLLRKAMVVQKLDGIIVHDPLNISYLSGFSSSNAALLVTHDSAVLLTDFRYIESAQKLTNFGFEVRLIRQDLVPQIAEAVKALKLQRVGFESALTWSWIEKLREQVGPRRMVDSGGVLTNLRMVKSADEIAVITKNQRLNERFLRAALQRFRPGATELHISRDIRADMLQADCSEAFGTIVAAGANSSLPHAVPGRQRATAGGYLLIDMGVKRDHYHSDMTRTFAVGKTDPVLRDIYDIVLEAQLAALSAVRAGVACSKVDKAARDIITKAGYGECFGHGLGHGVGLAIHEGPRLAPTSTDVLREGMVITIEPGIYVPNLGGVRIEDLVVVTRHGCENLTRMPKSWKTLGIGRE